MSYDDEPTQSMSLNDETRSEDSEEPTHDSFIDSQSISDDGPPKKLGKLLLPPLLDSPPPPKRRRSPSPKPQKLQKRLRLLTSDGSSSDEPITAYQPSQDTPVVATPVQTLEDIYGPSIESREPKANKAAARKHWVFRMSCACQTSTDTPALTKEALVLQQLLIDISEQFAFQIEVAPKTGYIHFQGYLSTKNQMRHSAIQNHLTMYQLHFHYIAPVAKRSPLS